MSKFKDNNFEENVFARSENKKVKPLTTEEDLGFEFPKTSRKSKPVNILDQYS